MSRIASDELRLRLLNRATPERPWSSCSETRRCVVCEQVFSGHDVAVLRGLRCRTRLRCPNCGSDPQLWVRPGNPLIDDAVWAEWESVIDASLTEEESRAHA